MPAEDDLDLATSDATSDAPGAPTPSLTPSEELGSMAPLLAAMARTGGPAALRDGTVVGGQYRIERPLGEGGMGVVYLARDTRLDREVAVKLGTAVSRSALRRIEREAMALARLSHPNVVVVYQVGEIDGRVFIAMEHVAGGTARSWLTATPRSTREVLALFAAAGDGLAAAHAAGLIHRDFKPDNVLVGPDGRPRVADFGLARWSDATEASPVPEGGEIMLTTHAGAIVGTPAYMPPEQLGGRELDARADQFAFAAALWEALFGSRPFDGKTPAEVKAAIESPTAAIEPRGRRVPRHVVAALRRALAADREARWPDLPALLAELRRDPGARRRRVAIAGAAVALVVAGAAVAVTVTRASEATPCLDGAPRIASMWNPTRRAALAARVGDLAWPAIAVRLEARATAWIAAHGATCRAARIDRSISAPLHDRRVLCLDERRAELDAVMVALESGSRTAIASAATTLDELPAVASCERPPSALDEEPAPTGADAERRLRAALVQIATAEAAAMDRATLDPLGKTERAVEAARAAGWRPRIAKALALRGAVLFELGRFDEAWADQDQAAQVALAARSDHIAVIALADAAWTLAELGRHAEADQALTTARSMWERTGRPPETGQRLFGAVAHVARRRGKPDQMLAATRHEVALAERAFGRAPSSVATTHLNLSLALLEVGQLPEAAAAADQAIASAEQAYGDHPTVAKMHLQAATVAITAGDLERALTQATEAFATLERWYGADDGRLVAPLIIVSRVQAQRGDLAAAGRDMRRALEIERQRTPTSPRIPELEANLAILASERGDFAEAASRGAAALSALETLHGPDSAQLVNALVQVAYAARERPDPDLDASHTHLVRALAIATAARGPDHPEVLNVTIELSHTLIKQARAADALAILTPWLARIASPDLAKSQPSELRFAVAAALATTGELHRACALASQAEDGYRAIAMTPMVDQVRGWRDHFCRPGAAR